MSQKATLERKKIREFNEFWEDLYKAFPEARRQAAETMGQALQGEVNARIAAADLAGGAKRTVQSWQELRLGSGGGYAAVSPRKGTVTSVDRGRHGSRVRQHTWKGQPVTALQVTRWLEHGHGVRKADTKGDYKYSKRRSQRWRALHNDSTNTDYIKGRMFYSWAKMKATDLALDAAERVLERISDEVDY